MFSDRERRRSWAPLSCDGSTRPDVRASVTADRTRDCSKARGSGFRPDSPRCSLQCVCNSLSAVAVAARLFRNAWPASGAESLQSCSWQSMSFRKSLLSRPLISDCIILFIKWSVLMFLRASGLPR